jgi:hypothetical protein
MTTPQSLLVVDGFTPHAKKLRAHYDARFADPRSTRGDRFVWDYWHVPGQYTALRTPAFQYFPEPLYRAFHEQLVWWGRRTLGCHDVSPPWMSCYVEGCRQELHGDLPHGPWAFVFSLTRWKQRTFRGGETMMLQDGVLDWWTAFESARHVEQPQLVRLVEPQFNRLAVFDPRIPHGVRRVEGTHDPREGRLVIHGWFVQPRPFVEGPLKAAALQSRIDAVTEAIMPILETGVSVAGMVSVRFGVTPQGRTRGVKVLCNNLRGNALEAEARDALVTTVLRTLRMLDFPRHKGPSTVTLPLVFER